MDAEEFSSLIDHTNLRPDASLKDIEQLCKEAKHYKFATVCVNPHRVKLAKSLVKNNAGVCTVIGFPLGATYKEIKAKEAVLAKSNGATEIDMVMNIGALKDKDYELVEEDIGYVKEWIGDTTLKVILENCYLTDNEKIRACKIAKKANADFVKTSTGFGKAGATVDDVALMRRTVGNKLGVKAAGGIGDVKTALEMIDAGANRLGMSRSVKVYKGFLSYMSEE